ncbi:MAG: RimJ/RimL family protein N-acetyltransferase [Psychroserpens sp.]|jgi:RimJ/RimL family protein N-acetyltransferase
MIILNSKIEDINKIFKLYKIATNFQKTKSAVPWPNFDRELIRKEIHENRQWKIIIDGEIACIWAITESDIQIWQERNKEPAIYIHRISTNPNFRGRNLVSEIAKWSKNYAIQKNKKFVRMDTVGENVGLINYYKKCGFDFLGLSILKDTSELPTHYNNATVSLFQMSV